MLNDPNVNAHIRIELAAIIDDGAPFVKATYTSLSVMVH